MLSILEVNLRDNALPRGLCRSRRGRGNCSLELGKDETSRCLVKDVKVVDDQLWRAVLASMRQMVAIGVPCDPVVQAALL